VEKKTRHFGLGDGKLKETKSAFSNVHNINKTSVYNPCVESAEIIQIYTPLSM
jgi:hypothetical protein